MTPKDLFDLTGKRALVTGATRGIGRAIAETFAAWGAKVVVSSRKADACAETVAAIEAAGGVAVASPANMSRVEEVEALAADALTHWGGVDVLVLNAAVNPYFGPMRDVTLDAYAKTMDTNVRNNMWLANKIAPQMAARKDGAIVILSSIGGLKGSEQLGVYGLSKAADMQLARNLCLEWGRDNIRANTIAPGIVRTDMAKALYENPKAHAAAIRTYPLCRFGEPMDIAGVALMLASKAGSWISGQTIVVDGGSTVSLGNYS